jgi:anthranilate phosphoribosyltransferase
MREILNRLFEYKSLDRDTAREILGNLAQGRYNPSEMAAFLTVYLMRSITVEELAGFRDAMLDLCQRVDLGGIPVIDLCGTGGDGKDTFNISTLASFVVAGAGQPVAKHGNNGVSSVCGSSNLLAYFGVRFSSDTGQLMRSLEGSGLCYLHAPLFHPAMKNVAPVRKELGVKTFFNMLGPLVNPAFPKSQITGVYSLELARLYNYLFQQTQGSYLVVHSLDGYDEISLTGPFKMIGRDQEKLLPPAELGLDTHEPEALSGGSTVEDAAAIALAILEGRGTRAQEEVVAANAGMALYCAGACAQPAEGIGLAMESLHSGKALNTFKKFIDINT